jgi:hypothetical protein
MTEKSVPDETECNCNLETSSGIRLEGVKKLQRISEKNTWLPGQELKPATPVQEAVLATQPQ